MLASNSGRGSPSRCRYTHECATSKTADRRDRGPCALLPSAGRAARRPRRRIQGLLRHAIAGIAKIARIARIAVILSPRRPADPHRVDETRAEAAPRRSADTQESRTSIDPTRSATSPMAISTPRPGLRAEMRTRSVRLKNPPVRTMAATPAITRTTSTSIRMLRRRRIDHSALYPSALSSTRMRACSRAANATSEAAPLSAPASSAIPPARRNTQVVGMAHEPVGAGGHVTIRAARGLGTTSGGRAWNRPVLQASLRRRRSGPQPRAGELLCRTSARRSSRRSRPDRSPAWPDTRRRSARLRPLHAAAFVSAE